jgi:ankyrin repeat protein
LLKLIAVLLQRGADPNIRLEKPPNLGRPAGDTAIGATAFLLAAASPDPEAMRMLAGSGADVKMATKEGLTPLMAAAGVERTQDFTDEERRAAFEAVRLAVELGNDVKVASADGLTALHGAASNGADDIVRYLVEHGADLDTRDRYQQTPLSVASGMRLPWIPYGEELGEIIRPSTAELLLALGATSLDAPGYFKPVEEDSEAYRINRSQRYGSADGPAVSP